MVFSGIRCESSHFSLPMESNTKPVKRSNSGLRGKACPPTRGPYEDTGLPCDHISAADSNCRKSSLYSNSTTLTSTQKSLYSITVLPSSATFASFLIVLSVFLVLTALLGLNLPNLLKVSRNASMYLKNFARGDVLPDLKARARAFCNRPYIRWYMNVLRPSRDVHVILDIDRWLSSDSDNDRSSLLRMVLLLSKYCIRDLPIILLHYYLVPEILYPEYQWFLLHRIGRGPIWTVRWYPPLVIVDLIRFSLIPLWTVLSIVLVLYLMFGDGLFAVYTAAFRRSRGSSLPTDATDIPLE